MSVIVGAKKSVCVGNVHFDEKEGPVEKLVLDVGEKDRFLRLDTKIEAIPSVVMGSILLTEYFISIPSVIMGSISLTEYFIDGVTVTQFSCSILRSTKG